MQNRQNGRRRRGGGGGGNNPRPMGMAQGGQNANRLEVRVRGNAHQLLEKYKQLARDAHQAGDRVATEYYLQHSDHYFRVLNDSRIRQEEMRARRGVFDPFEDEPAGGDSDGESQGGEQGGAEQGGGEQPGGGERPRPQPRGEGERRPRGDRGDRGDRPQRAERGDRAEDGERPRWERRERSEERGEDAPRAARGRAGMTQAEVAQPEIRQAEMQLSDGEAALVAFGGAPAREAADAEEAPKPRRRGRPRKIDAEPVES